jgi:hypothetical protein
MNSWNEDGLRTNAESQDLYISSFARRHPDPGVGGSLVGSMSPENRPT